MPFTYTQKIKFRHCDPAGIVFYPRYFEMMNDTVEAFFDNVLHYPFADVMGGNGVPTAQIACTFTAPSRLGDVLEISLQITRLGRSSLDLAYVAHSTDEVRFKATSTLVFIQGEGVPTPWPDAVRSILRSHVEGDTA